MKRCWVGVIFLLVLLVGSLGVSWAMEKIHSPVEECLNQAARQALLGDWEQSEALFRRAREEWERWDHVRACFADHTPVEEISAGLRGLEVYCREQEEADFAARCLELAQKTAAVADAHSPKWQNLF